MLATFLGCFLGCVANTIGLLLFTQWRDRSRKKENEAYKQKLLDILQETPDSDAKYTVLVPKPKAGPNGN